MSRDVSRKDYYSRDRDWGRDRGNYRSRPFPRKRSRSPIRNEREKRRSRSPRKNDKDIIDDNILSEISKLPEPSELWDSQFQDTNFAGPPPPPSFQQEQANSAYTNYQPTYSGLYDDFPPSAAVPAIPHPPDISAWNQMSLPPPQGSAPPAPFINTEDQMKKEAAIESEMRHQKAALSKQREDYIKKTSILKKELDTLKDQRNELRGDPKRSPSPDTKRFLKENTKLQLEIQNKLKTINNVVDMLNGIIGEEAQEVVTVDDSPERTSKRKSRSPSGKKFNYVYYDPEMHWCRVCNEFPPTAKDYLNHLHSAAHHKMAAAHMEAPWHSVSGVNDGFPNYASAPTKRTPIRGLQFFVPSTAWYCKLCDQFIGDLHCASAHLKSVMHSKNYTNFVEQNPHWETDWMSDRQKAFEKARASNKNKGIDDKPQYTAHTITFNKDGFHTKRNKDSPHKDDKKRRKDKKKRKAKKQSSSSSSDSSSSDSDRPHKKKIKKEIKVEPDDKSLTEWMSSIQMERLNDNDRKLLDTLKTRIKLDKNKRRTPSRQERERSASGQQRKSREAERRSQEARGARRDVSGGRRSADRRERSWEERRPSPQRPEPKKPEIKKMPFIGKMPVYKNLTKKTEDLKKEEEKKKEDDEASKKRREEMDAEIQKKVAEFKEKIAKAQLERAAELPPPALALPTSLGSAPPFLPLPTPTAATPVPTPQPPQQTLAKDFQDALDIIFPKDVNPECGQPELFPGMPPMAGFPLGIPGMPGFPPNMMPLMQPNMPQMMMGFDMNAPLFPPRHQLYDNHVPLVPKRQHKNNRKQDMKHKQNNQTQDAAGGKRAEDLDGAKKREELDELAMLGIDASDVGAGM